VTASSFHPQFSSACLQHRVFDNMMRTDANTVENILSKDVDTLDNTFTIKKKHARGWKKPPGKPKRPLSAYNIFFQLERDRIVNDEIERQFTKDDVAKVRVVAGANMPKRRDRKIHGKIAFVDLARTIGIRWKNLSESERGIFYERAGYEKLKYDIDVATWIQKRNNSHKNELVKVAAKVDMRLLKDDVHLTSIDRKNYANVQNSDSTPLYSTGDIHQTTSDDDQYEAWGETEDMHSYQSQSGAQYNDDGFDGSRGMNQRDARRVSLDSKAVFDIASSYVDAFSTENQKHGINANDVTLEANNMNIPLYEDALPNDGLCETDEYIFDEQFGNAERFCSQHLNTITAGINKDLYDVKLMKRKQWDRTSVALPRHDHLYGFEIDCHNLAIDSLLLTSEDRNCIEDNFDINSKRLDFRQSRAHTTFLQEPGSSKQTAASVPGPDPWQHDDQHLFRDNIPSTHFEQHYGSIPVINPYLHLEKRVRLCSDASGRTLSDAWLDQKCVQEELRRRLSVTNLHLSNLRRRRMWCKARMAKAEAAAISYQKMLETKLPQVSLDEKKVLESLNFTSDGCQLRCDDQGGYDYSIIEPSHFFEP
jgi:hypothetical protein